MVNTRETMGEQACLDALVANTLTDFEDDEIIRVKHSFKGSLLRSISLPNCTEIASGTFQSCHSLVSALLPRLSSVASDAFQYSENLTTLQLDSATGVNSYAFGTCTSLESVVLPSANYFSNGAFQSCTRLHTFDCGEQSNKSYSVSTSSSENPFLSCLRLRHLIIRNPGKGNISVFPENRINETAIYVRSDVIDSYKSAYPSQASMFHTLEEYPITDFSTISDSWSEIITASDNGTYDSKYNVGDTKSMVIDGNTYYFQLVAKDADVLASDGTTTVPMTWVMFKKVYLTEHVINENSTLNSSWETVSLRSWLNDTIFPLMPAEVRTAIKEVRKYSDGYVDGAIIHDQVTADKLWVPSAREVTGGSSYEQSGPIYSEVFSSNANRVKYSQSVVARSWALRTNHSGVNNRIVSSNGSVDNASIDSAYGIAIGFCI